MKSFNRIILILSLVAPLFFFGCISSSYEAGGIKPSFVPVESFDYLEKNAISTKASSFDLFWIWTVTPPASMDRAIRASISEERADNLINITWDIEHQFWLVGTVHIVHIKGIPIEYKAEDEELTD